MFLFSETFFKYIERMMNVISVDTHGLFPWFLQRIHKLMLQSYMIQCINNDRMRCMIVIISQTTKEIQSQSDGQQYTKSGENHIGYIKEEPND